jgi:hypothetical protein
MHNKKWGIVLLLAHMAHPILLHNKCITTSLIGILTLGNFDNPIPLQLLVSLVQIKI